MNEKVLETKEEAKIRYLNFRSKRNIMNGIISLSTISLLIYLLLFFYKKINSNNYELIIVSLIYAILFFQYINFWIMRFSNNKIYKEFVIEYDKKEIKREVNDHLTKQRRNKVDKRNKENFERQKRSKLFKNQNLKHQKEMTDLEKESILIQEETFDSKVELEKAKTRMNFKREDLQRYLNEYLNSLKQEIKTNFFSKQNKNEKLELSKNIEIIDNNLKNVSDNDFYDILGINPNSNLSEIKTAYKTLAKKYHPDLNFGDDKHFIKLNEAYQKNTKK